MTEHMHYEAPTLSEIGTVHELTLQGNNKVGQGSDVFTALSGGALVGSIVPAP